MKKSEFIFLGFCLCCCVFAQAAHLPKFSEPETDPIEEVLQSWVWKVTNIRKHYLDINRPLQEEINAIGHKLRHAKSLEKKVNLLVRKDLLEQQLQKNKFNEKTDISKIRYLKGLEVVKLLYGKTLALDHHFSSIATFHEISKIANPNFYPAFIQYKDKLAKKQDKNLGFRLTSLLGSNMYTSIVHSMVNLFTNDKLSKSEKEEGLKEIECILDFTLRMHDDLNTIYFETSYLQKSNQNLMVDLQRLFTEYTQPLDYNTPLADCRKNDDWGQIRKKLDSYVKEMNAHAENGEKDKSRNMRIDLEFPIDRLLRFIMAYNDFIDEGTEFYEKFKIMLDSYENEEQCSAQMPFEYKELKASMDMAIEKFTTAYRPVEINGSKMKQLLYGINEYE